MIKVIQSIIFILLLSSCHQGSSYVSRYGQSIVLNPNETQSISGNTENISDQKINPKESLTDQLKKVQEETSSILAETTKTLKH